MTEEGLCLTVVVGARETSNMCMYMLDNVKNEMGYARTLYTPFI